MIRLIWIPLLAAQLSFAQPPEGGRGQREGGGPPGGFMRFSPLLSALDTNHDGVISESEIANAAKSLLALDKNGDGMLSAEEMRANFGPGGPGGPEGRRQEGPRDEGRREDPAAELVKTLMAFDKNGDGKLSMDELPERMQGMFARGDANKDGFLTPDEIAKMATVQAAPGNRPERRDERGGPGGPGGMRRVDAVMTALDANNDGSLSAEEIKNAPAALKRLDKNGDGKITEDEVRPNFPPRREE